MAAGRVERFNGQYVWLYALPEQGRFPAEREYQGPVRVRSYYLNTTLPDMRLAEVEAALKDQGLAQDFLARSRGGLVAILGRNGAPFRQLMDAERDKKDLRNKDADLVRNPENACVENSTLTLKL